MTKFCLLIFNWICTNICAQVREIAKEAFAIAGRCREMSGWDVHLRGVQRCTPQWSCGDFKWIYEPVQHGIAIRRCPFAQIRLLT